MQPKPDVRRLLRGRAARIAAMLALAALTLAGCTWFEEEEEILEGPRQPVRQALGADDGPAEAIRRPLPQARPLADWPQANVTPANNGGHITGPTDLSRAWTADAGTGTSEDSMITSAPVVAGGTVYTLDAAATVTAFDARTGAERWQAELLPNEEEEGEEGFGGGLVATSDRVFATTGFGEVLALSATDGSVIWRQRFSGPFRAGPTLGGGRLVAVTRNSQAFALNPDDGTILWRAQGVEAQAGYLGGAVPAVAGSAALVPFASGELVALELGSGRQAWAAVLTGGRRGLARAAITDLTGDPVVIGPLVVSANQSGRLAALEGTTGRRAWTRVVGSTAPIWAAGDTLFLVSDTAVLLRLDAGTGRTLWQQSLPAFEDPEDREDPITYSGPVLVSGRLLMTDSTGQFLSFDALTGEGGAIAEVPGGSTTGPVVAGDTVYVLSEDGDLHAYR